MAVRSSRREGACLVAKSDSHGVTVTMTHGAVRHSATVGAFIGSYATVNGDLESSNEWEDNAGGDVVREP
jgi:hypothetical protein